MAFTERGVVRRTGRPNTRLELVDVAAAIAVLIPAADKVTLSAHSRREACNNAYVIMVMPSVFIHPEVFAKQRKHESTQ